jgi:hypothetical protein
MANVFLTSNQALDLARVVDLVGALIDITGLQK